MSAKSKKYIEEMVEKLQNAGLEGGLKNSYYYKLFSEAQKKIHAQILEKSYSTDKLAAAETGTREEIFDGVNYKRTVLYLMSNGCEWALKSAHGCTMCGHLAKQTRRNIPIPVDDFLEQFVQEFEQIDFKRYPILNLYNNGSFINDNEIHPNARKYMLKKIGQSPDIKMVVIESRPEFVTEEKVIEIKKFIPDKHVEIGVGLEMKDDFYRTICTNKGFSLKRYNIAAETITKYLNLRTYVLLKPLFLTEKEGIEQAVETVEHAFEVGSTTVSLEACTIQDYTLMKYFYDHGLYSTPWLWSIVEVVRRVKANKKLIIGLFKFYPSPTAVPHNCKNCNERVMKRIIEYNQTLNKNIFDGITCDCYKEWKEALDESTLSFEDRFEPINKLLESL